jgi:hypothetical protein
MVSFLLLALLLATVVLSDASAPLRSAVEEYDVIQYINPLIGSTNGGSYIDGIPK